MDVTLIPTDNAHAAKLARTLLHAAGPHRAHEVRTRSDVPGGLGFVVPADLAYAADRQPAGLPDPTAPATAVAGDAEPAPGDELRGPTALAAPTVAPVAGAPPDAAPAGTGERQAVVDNSAITAAATARTQPRQSVTRGSRRGQ